jgi:hypothetical protein
VSAVFEQETRSFPTGDQEIRRFISDQEVHFEDLIKPDLLVSLSLVRISPGLL